jgi:hypothetical protein
MGMVEKRGVYNFLECSGSDESESGENWSSARQ